MSAKRTLPIQFPPTTTFTEKGDGVSIHWTHQYDQNLAHKPFRCVCASVESTRTAPKRMVKYLRQDER